MKMNLVSALIRRGWSPIDDEFELWVHEDHYGTHTVFWAAELSGFKVRHLWNPETMSCFFCGMTQHRVLVQGESVRCMGIPDAKAFQDSADHAKLQERIKQALGGEEGMIWDVRND